MKRGRIGGEKESLQTPLAKNAVDIEIPAGQAPRFLGKAIVVQCMRGIWKGREEMVEIEAHCRPGIDLGQLGA